MDNQITNWHDDHIASCLCCKNLGGGLGDSSWNEDTPGATADIQCFAGVFHYRQNDDMLAAFVVLHNTARACISFRPRQ